MKKIVYFWVLILGILLFFDSGKGLVYALGLSTNFGEVLLDNLQPGKTYSTKNIINMPLRIVNTDKTATDLKIEILIPKNEPANLKEGFEPIPDSRWIRLEKEHFENVRPGEIAETDVIITIPESSFYAGKKYQVYFYSHTISKSGTTIAVGLRSRLLFTVRQKKGEKISSEESILKRLLNWLGIKK